MPNITISNTTGHPQEFEVHGWNNNKNITVGAHGKQTIPGPDKSSGAIIALHNGHEGEQAEGTFNGFGGNDFFDISMIVGAGGNLTIEQQGDPKTRKGDPQLMQKIRAAWQKADGKTKGSLKNFVHLDGSGLPVRVDAPKDHPELEKWLRTTGVSGLYIGVGSWAGNPGNPDDNKQSSAAHGTKPWFITYSDASGSSGDHGKPSAESSKLVAEDSSAGAHHHSTNHHHSEGHNHSTDHHHSSQSGSGHMLTAQTHPEDLRNTAQDQGPGIVLGNKSNKEQAYYFYNNVKGSDGKDAANFDHPLKSTTLKAHSSSFVSLPASFKGRVQRGKLIPATWAEFQLDASNDHGAHGDISLEQGCDGAATISSTDGSHRTGGFTEDILKGAPAAAFQTRADGARVLASTMGNWLGGPNQAAIDYERKVVGQKKAYITGGTGTDDIASKNQRLAVDFY
ncbi:MAG: hypothetical protein M1812_006649 [Candelaria pacifica]|nr:MAG: hypothetical protein M1812_006649 [Candelaria pacifica]